MKQVIIRNKYDYTEQVTSEQFSQIEKSFPNTFVIVETADTLELEDKPSVPKPKGDAAQGQK